MICQNANLTEVIRQFEEEAGKYGNPFYEEGYGEVTQMEKKKEKKKKK